MADFNRVAKENKIDMHKEQLEILQKHGDNLAERKEHANRMFEFMKSKAQDSSDLMNIETAKENVNQNFIDAFREEVEDPSKAIKDKLYEDINEIEKDSDNLRKAADQTQGFGVADNAADDIKSKLNDSAQKDDAMARGARDIIGKNDDSVHKNYIHILSRYS